MLRIFSQPSDELALCAIETFKPTAPNCTIPGSAAEIFFGLISYIGIPFELILHPSPKPYGDFVNGKWINGIFDLIENGTVDFMVKLWRESNSRRSRFTFSYPIADSELIFISKAPSFDLLVSSSLLFKTFDYWIWLSLLLTLTVTSLWRLARYVKPYLWSKGLIIIMLFTATIFTSLYRSGLLKQLVKPPLKYYVRNLNHMVELIECGELKLIVEDPYGAKYGYILYSTSHLIGRLRNALIHNPPYYTHNNTEAAIKVSHGGYVFLTSTTSTPLSYLKQFACDLTIIPTKYLPKDNKGFIFRHGSPWLPVFNKAILNMYNFIETTIEKYERVAGLKGEIRCATILRESGVRALHVLPLIGAFGLLYVALALCFV